jgi:hypothetical protein
MSNLNNGGLTRVLNYIKTWVNGLLSSKSDTSHTHTKSQITDFPSIPSKTSDLTNDSGFLTTHQSLSNYVDRSSEQTISGNKTFDNRTRFKKGNYIHSFGSSADVGYIKFATITNDTGATYQDCTATLVIMNRKYLKPVCVYIKFNGTDNADPNINFFATDATDNNANDYYLVKSATSTWDLYVYKTAWNSFTVLDFWQPQNNAVNLTFTWKSEFVSSLPSGYIKATFSAYNYNDLSNKPTIPTNTNQLTNGSGYLSGTVAIDNGGTGATTRTGAVANLTNDNIGTGAQYFLTITDGWSRVGYSSVANAKSVLGVPSIDLRPQASADANTVSDGVSITHYGSNGPSTSLGASTNDGALFQQCWSSAWKAQIAADYRNGNLFTRGKNNGTWQPWRAVAYQNGTNGIAFGSYRVYVG